MDVLLDVNVYMVKTNNSSIWNRKDMDFDRYNTIVFKSIYVRNSGFFMVSLIGIMLFITFLVRLGNDNVNFILYTIILILSVGDMEVDDICKVTFICK